MNLHICLVSDQLLANHIPVLMYKPDQVHLVSSDHVRNKGLTSRFEKMLQEQGFLVVTHDGMPDSDMQRIRDFAEALAKRLGKQAPNATITLNLTGGNKLMTLGMWEVFDGAVEMIYTDTLHQCIEHLHDQARTPLPSVLNINHYLQAYGVKYLWALSDDESWVSAVESRKSVSRYLAEKASALEGFIGTMNYLVGNAVEEVGRQLMLRYPEQSMATRPRGVWREALLNLQNAGLLAWDGDRAVTFSDAESARYLGGIWLEEYVYLIARDASPEHVACSVKINWDSSRQTTNELDVIVVHQNRMLIIECKTLRLGRDDQKDSDMVYKISNLGDELRGLFGSTWLVSAREPDTVLVERAKSRQLHIIAAGELKNLRQHILSWMK